MFVPDCAEIIIMNIISPSAGEKSVLHFVESQCGNRAFPIMTNSHLQLDYASKQQMMWPNHEIKLPVTCHTRVNPASPSSESGSSPAALSFRP